MKKIFFVLLFLASLTIAHAQTDTIRPSVPASVTATAVLPSGVNVSWTASTDNVAVAGYNLYRNGMFLTVIGGTTFGDSGLAPGGYVYTVAAYDAAGNTSNQSLSGNAYLPDDRTPPSSPTGVLVSVTATSTAATTTATVTWAAATDAVGVTGYEIYRNRILLTTSTTPYTSLSYSDIIYAGTYSYTITAHDASHNESAHSAPASITVIWDSAAPTAPINLSAKITSPTSVALTWSPSIDLVGIKGYNIYKNGVLISDGTVTGTSYTDTNSTSGSYSYNVAAYDAAGNASLQSRSAHVDILNDVTPPQQPWNFAGKITTAGAVQLTWGRSYDDISTNVVDYYIYCDDVTIGQTTTTSYLDTQATSGSRTYKIAAKDPSGNMSLQSQPIIVKVPVPPPPAPSSTVTTPLPAPSPSPVSPTPTPLPPPAPTPSTSQILIDNIGGPTIFTVYLAYGSRHAQVLQLQTLLVSKGYLSSDGATGFFGMLTQEALQKFQCDQNIICAGTPASTGWGTVGGKTRAALNGATPSPLPPPPMPPAPPSGATLFTVYLAYGSRHPEVTQLQAVLVARGYLTADSATGFFGMLTQEALQKFQCDQNIICAGTPASTGWGTVGGKTRAALNSLPAQ